MNIERRDVLKGGLAAAAIVAAGLPMNALAKPVQVRKRTIPVSGERLGVIGTGSANVYGFDPEKLPNQMADCRAVLETMIFGGGKVIDTASDYGPAEERLGTILRESGLRPKLFIATKVGSRHDVPAALEVMRRSNQRLGIDQVDLMQIHDMTDPETSLRFLRDWQQQGHTRYIGVASMFKKDYAAIEKTLLREKPDFLQINLTMDERWSEERLLPLAADKGIAVIINSPFGQNRLFRAVVGRTLPPWAIEFEATTWAQFFLKFVVSHPAVTCVIPGTGRPANMLDNLEAGRGRLPDARQRRKMIEFIDTIIPPTA